MEGFPHAEFESLNALFRILEEETPPQKLLDQTVHLAVESHPLAHLGAITLIEAGGITTAAQTDPLAEEIDALERETGEGPCIEALRSGVLYRVDDYESDERWPLFARAVLDRGIRSSLGVPLKVEEEVRGALNLYSKEPQAFIDADVPVVELFAKRASVGLANAEIHRTNTKMIRDLEEAMQSRELIGQAQGILMERESCSAEQAFQMMVRASQNLNIKLREIARRVVEDKQKGP